MFEDIGPCLELEEAVGYKDIVQRAQKQLESREVEDSDSSDEAFNWNLGDSKEKRLDEYRKKEEALINARKKLTSRERLDVHR